MKQFIVLLGILFASPAFATTNPPPSIGGNNVITSLTGVTQYLPSTAFPTTGQQLRINDGTGAANTHNIVITPSSANIDGSSTYTISTAWGSWSGEFISGLFKTVSKL